MKYYIYRNNQLIAIISAFNRQGAEKQAAQLFGAGLQIRSEEVQKIWERI